MGFQPSLNPKKTNLIVRTTFEDKKEIKNRADDCALTLTDYVIKCCLGRQTRTRMDVQIINELRLLGNQQKELFQKYNGQHSTELSNVLDRLIAAADRIYNDR